MRRLALMLGPLFVILLYGCDQGEVGVRPVEAAPLGATPAIRVPIGPIPGPGKEPLAVTSPYKKNPVALQQGRTLFVWYNCAGCHGGHGGGGMGPSLRDRGWIYGNSDAHIYDSIAEGRAYGMPAWGLKLPDDHIWKLVSYIDSMGTEWEPDPPIVTQPKVKLPPEHENLQQGDQ